MKLSICLVLFILASCSHQKKTTTCHNKEIIDLPLKLAQCFNDTKQPLKALSIHNQFSKEDLNNIDWNIVEFESYLILKKEKNALLKLHSHLAQSPAEKYFIRLLHYYQNNNEKEAFESLRSQALKLYPDNKDIQMFNSKES
jgi:hypothetical protein